MEAVAEPCLLPDEIPAAGEAEMQFIHRNYIPGYGNHWSVGMRIGRIEFPFSGFPEFQCKSRQNTMADDKGIHLIEYRQQIPPAKGEEFCRPEFSHGSHPHEVPATFIIPGIYISFQAEIQLSGIAEPTMDVSKMRGTFPS